MTCVGCNRNLVRCICEDCDERVEGLRGSPFLHPAMIDLIQAERLLAKHEIEADRKAARESKEEEP